MRGESFDMEIDKKLVKKILVIKTSALGDIVRAMPALVTVAKTFPDAKLSFLVGERFVELVEPCPYLSEIIPYRKRKNTEDLLGFIRFAMEIRERKFDLVLNFQNTRRFDLLARISGARWKTDIVTLDRPMNGVEGVFEILRTVGIRPNRRFYEFWFEEADLGYAADFLERNDIAEGEKIVGLNPGGGWTSKQWPLEHYAELATKLAAGAEARIVVFGSGEERDRAEKIAKDAGCKVAIAAGETTIRQAAAIIRRCSAFVSNDSGLMHIAALLDIPTVGIFGPTNPAYHGPCGDGHLIFYRGVECSPCSKPECHLDFERYYCIDAIPVTEVYKGVRRIMR